MIWFFVLFLNAAGCGYYIHTLKSKPLEKWHIIYPAATVIMTLAWVFFTISFEHAVMLAASGVLAYFTYDLYKQIRLI